MSRKSLIRMYDGAVDSMLGPFLLTLLGKRTMRDRRLASKLDALLGSVDDELAPEGQD